MAEIIIRGESAELAEIARLLRVLEQPAPSQDGSAAHRLAQIGVVLGRLLKPSEPTEPLLLAEQAVARLQGMRERLVNMEALLQQRKGEAERLAALEQRMRNLGNTCDYYKAPADRGTVERVRWLLSLAATREQERDTAQGMADSYGTRIGELEAEVESITEDRDKALAFVDVQAERIDRLQRAVNEASRIMDAFWPAVERGGLTVVRDAVEAWQADDLDKVESIDFRDPVYDAEE